MTRLALVRRAAFALPLLLAACGSPGADATSAQGSADENPGTTSQAITGTLPAGATNVTLVQTVNIGSCLISVGHADLAGPPFPPQHIAFVERRALAASCTGPTGYQVLGSSYNVPQVALAKGASNEIAASFTQKVTPSGSAHTHLEIRRVDPTNLTVLASDALYAASPSSSSPQLGNVTSASLVFTVPGALIVSGAKDGDIAGELGVAGGLHYQSTWGGFASSTTSNVAPTQTIAW